MELGRPQDLPRQAALLDDPLHRNLGSVVRVGVIVDSDDGDRQQVAQTRVGGRLDHTARALDIDAPRSERVAGEVHHRVVPRHCVEPLAGLEVEPDRGGAPGRAGRARCHRHLMTPLDQLAAQPTAELAASTCDQYSHVNLPGFSSFTPLTRWRSVL